MVGKPHSLAPKVDRCVVFNNLDSFNHVQTIFPHVPTLNAVINTARSIFYESDHLNTSKIFGFMLKCVMPEVRFEITNLSVDQYKLFRVSIHH